jgi:aminopeptidase N
MGHEVLKEATQNYFSRFAFKNTVLTDFIDCLSDAYKNHSDGELDIYEWADSWLKTQGVNIIEPKLTYNSHSNTIEKFEIIQSFDKNCDEVYRAQKIDIAFYTENDEEIIYPEIIVEPNEVTRVKGLEGKPIPQAVLLNANNFGYCKVRFNQKSLNYFFQKSYIELKIK